MRLDDKARILGIIIIGLSLLELTFVPGQWVLIFTIIAGLCLIAAAEVIEP